MGAAWEAIGFALRILNIMYPTSNHLAVGSQLLILLSPLWVNAFVYMLLGRMVYYWIPDQKVWKVKARTLTQMFVAWDIMSFIVRWTSPTKRRHWSILLQSGIFNYSVFCYIQRISLKRQLTLSFRHKQLGPPFSLVMIWTRRNGELAFVSVFPDFLRW